MYSDIVNTMLNYLFTVPKAAVLYSITAFDKLNFGVLSLFILFNTLKVEGKACYWTVIIYGLTSRSANSVLTKDGFVVWSIFVARQVTSRADIRSRTRLVLWPNCVFKSDSTTFATVSGPIQNVLNNGVAPSHVKAVFRILWSIITSDTLPMKIVFAAFFSLEAVTHARNAIPNLKNELIRV